MNKWFIYVLFGLFMSIGLASAVCTTTYNNQDSTDYFGVNVLVDNVTTVSSTQIWTDWDFFTPRLNFTRPINETILGGVANTNTSINWIIHDGVCNTSLVIKNGSNAIGVGNYSFVWNNLASGRVAIAWKASGFNGTTLLLECNRTFVKNVDDIIYASTTINSNTDRTDWLTENSPTDYGDYKTFRFDNNIYGQVVNNSNWAIGWNYTQIDCSLGDYGCSAGASSLWGTLTLIVVAGFLLYLVATFFEGNVTIAIIIYVAIVATLIPFLIGILNQGC